jgi:hypothetical protein
MKYIFTCLLATVCLLCQAQFRTIIGTHVVNQGMLVLNDLNFESNGITKGLDQSKLVLTGSQQTTISGRGSVQLYALEIAKSANGIDLQKNISVAGPLKFTKGSINLNNSQLELVYPGGLLQQESGANRIFTTGTGEVFIQQALNAPAGVNPGNLGAVITMGGDAGVVTIRRGHAVQTTAAQAKSVKRYYLITPANNTGLHATVRMQYFDEELNDLPEENLHVFSKNGAADWQLLGRDAGNTAENYVQKQGVNEFVRFSLFNSNASLPLQLTSLKATCQNGNTLLKWATANETGTKQFTIEKSIDQQSWQPAQAVPAQGFAQQHQYSTTIEAREARFFRLKMEDIDGSYTYSHILTAPCELPLQVAVGPNPTNGQVFINATLVQSTPLLVRVQDFMGRTVITQSWQAAPGFNRFAIDLGKLPAALYLVQVSGQGMDATYRIVKK